MKKIPTKTLDEYLDEVMQIEFDTEKVSKKYVDQVISGVKVLLDE